MSDTAIAKTVEIDEKKIVEFMNSSGVGADLNDGEKKQFIEVAKAYQLNPFKREIYCIAYGKGQYRKLSIITGYEVYLKRAERTGKLNGWKVDIAGTRKGNDLRAIVTIHRKDWTEPFVHETYWVEYKQDNRMWKGKPITMIKKVAMAQAFRLCFPDEFGGMPYTSDELPDEMTGYRDVSDTQEPEKKPEKTEKQEKTDNVKIGIDDQFRQSLKEQLQGSVLLKFITEEDRDAVIEKAAGYSGENLQKYCQVVSDHLYQLKGGKPKKEEAEDAEVEYEDPSQQDFWDGEEIY